MKSVVLLKKELTFLAQRRARWLARRREVHEFGSVHVIINALRTDWSAHLSYLEDRIERVARDLDAAVRPPLTAKGPADP